MSYGLGRVRVAQSLSSSLETFVPMYSDCQCRWVRSPVKFGMERRIITQILTAIAYCLHAVQLIRAETMASN